MNQDDLPIEAIGEDEIQRPQPADDPIKPVDSQDMYRVMRHTIGRLEKDQTARGDLKILSRSIRELRYAFKVFRPYRRRRKLTIFGSARTKPDHPEYQAAVELGQRMAKHGWMVITGAGVDRRSEFGSRMTIDQKNGSQYILIGAPLSDGLGPDVGGMMSVSIDH